MSKTSPKSLGEYLAKKITSPHNQHVILRFVGIAGMGKSYAAIDLCMDVAEHVARIKGGKPTDYYNFSKHLAVMSEEKTKEVLTDPGKYCILQLDDMGVPLNARNFNSKFNIDVNDVLQTFRPNNNLVVMTMQSGFLVDKVPRSISHIEVEMESANFDERYSIAKVQRIVFKHKTGKIHYPYLVIDGKKYVRHIFEKPPEDIARAYEEERSKQLKALQDSKTQAAEEPKQKQTVGMIFGPTWLNLQSKGYSCREIGLTTGHDHTTVSKYFKQHEAVA